MEEIKKIIIDSNPLTEAFGNAKTVRNDNSSRFGKYLEIQFNQARAPVGGVISTFLLEKSRVAYQQKGERNFHIFYQLIAGADATMKNNFGINCDQGCFYYLSQSGCTTVDGVDDGADYREVAESMRTVGFSEQELHDSMQVLAAILHIGNIRFQGDEPATVRDQQPLEAAAALLAIDPKFLESSLNHRHIQSGSARATQYAVPQNVEQSSGIRDALAKTLYARLFDFVVDKINRSMKHSGSDMSVVGVLDIYGFEIFDNNSFEQFCINYVNEKLQQIFIDLTVRGEQAEYHEEGMKWKDIKFFDNKIVCELIEGRRPPGIMRLLDDNCRSVHALESSVADAKFMEKLAANCGSHAHLLIAQGGSGTEFTIKHYAGDVTYNVDEFCVKNNDNLYVALVNACQASQIPFIVSLFPEDMSDDKRAPTTASFKIRESASFLVSRLSACTPHYIRCIKSNDKKLPLTFNAARVEHQVKYLGLLENVKVKRAGYAYRHMKHIFLARFGCLVQPPPSTIPEFVTGACKLYKELDANEFEEGKTKIFVRSPETIFMLEELLLKTQDPEAYKEKMKAFKESEKLAQAKQGKHSMKTKCAVM